MSSYTDKSNKGLKYYLRASLRRLPGGTGILVERAYYKVRDKGLVEAWKATQRYFKALKIAQRMYNGRVKLSPEEAEAQRNHVFADPKLNSVVVPMYNTPEKFLRELIESVQAQTYPNWELCLADGSDAQHGDVQRICEEYAAKDPRIKYLKLEKNLGISANTNAALAMTTGDYISLLDHDDMLHPAALFEVQKAIEQGGDFIYTDEMTFKDRLDKPTVVHCKPDFAIDNLRANNYICHLSTFSRGLYEKVGGLSEAHDGSQDYDLILRMTEQAQHIIHIPKLLYFWRNHAGSVARNISAKPYCIDAAKKALGDHLERSGLKGEAIDAPPLVSLYRIKYELTGHPLISIIIPNKDHIGDLRRCLDSIGKSTYAPYEILVVENNSTEQSTFDYYQEIEQRDNLSVLRFEGPFNFSKINNFAVAQAQGGILLFLNNDTEVINEDWMEEMLMFAQRPDVGAVGAKLYFPDDTIQHAGMIIGLKGTAGHVHYHVPPESVGYMGRAYYQQNFSAVTAACLMVRKEAFDQVGGFNEELAVAYNDVDFCLKLRKAGYLNVFTPFARLYHYESASRGSDKSEENQARFQREEQLFKDTWKDILEKGDPYYNPNLRLDRSDFVLWEKAGPHQPKDWDKPEDYE